MLWFLLLLSSGDIYFQNASYYDVKTNQILERRHLLINEQGVVELITDKPITVAADAEVISGALILPHLTDFYVLMQERGLGFDQDAGNHQRRIFNALTDAGYSLVRDPVMTRDLLAPTPGNSPLYVVAQGGYVAPLDSAGAAFGKIWRPGVNLADLQLPPGPVTLWWTNLGSARSATWPQYGDDVRELIAFVHARGDAVGAYIQDANAADMAALYGFNFDFYEGLPATLDPLRVPNKVIWAPMAALNDRRYCAYDLKENLARAGRLGLYGPLDLSMAEERMELIRMRIGERCLVWRKRRKETLAPLKDWLEAGRPLAIGSSGGHLFAMSGDIISEMEILEKMGAEDPDLLAALFQHTPGLFRRDLDYLKPGAPAHFIVYTRENRWRKIVGNRVDFNFVAGKRR